MVCAYCQAEVRINEVMASNVRSFPNAMDFEDYPDWLELYNSSDSQLSLAGYYLSDNSEEPKKWAFSTSSFIGPGEHLVIVADGHDRYRGSRLSRDYEGGLDFTTQFHHTNFQLSSAGETLFLNRDLPAFSPVVTPQSSWKYLSTNSSLPRTWFTPSFDDSSWDTGDGVFGFDAPYLGNLVTEVEYGPSKSDKHITTYFRRKFTTPLEASLDPIGLWCKVNDGAVMYLNGEEILRYNLPEGPIDSETLATEELTPFASFVQVFVQVQALSDNIVNGENIIAVEVHQASPTSRDLYFDVEYAIRYSTQDPIDQGLLGPPFEGKEWHFLDDGSSPPPSWKELSFDDSGWKTGDSAHGYAEQRFEPDPILTPFPYGDDKNAKNRYAYFRKQFHVAVASEADGLRLNYLVDDGARFYLNGSQIHSENMSPVTELSASDTEVSNPTWKSAIVSADALHSGENTLAVLVQQASPSSPSMRFDASLEIVQLDDTEVIDEIIFGPQVSDVSFGLDPSNPDNWVYLESPTPGEENSGAVITEIRETGPAAQISPEAGLYLGNQTITIAAHSGEIRYTTDGSNPSPDSSLYTAPFEITETTVVRAQVFGTGKVPGEIVTQTYFIGESFANGLPLVSLTAPPETLFGQDIGIYGHARHSGGNIHKGVDAPGNLEFFPPDGSAGFSVNGGFRLGGENNFLSHGQKAFNFATRGKYGHDAIHYDLFPGSGVGTFTGLTLREGGDDWGKAHLTDAIWDPLVKGRMEAETNRYRPAALFINGEYWGLYNIRDRWDENWFYQEYGTDDGNYDRIRSTLSSGYEIEDGESDEWYELLSYLSTTPPNDPDFWSVVSSNIDIDSLADFTICESYGRNSSWRNNREWWKDRRNGGKWRLLLPDMDRTLGNSSSFSNIGSLLFGDKILSEVRAVPEFQVRLLQRAAAHCADTLSENRVRDMITSLGLAAAPEIPRQTERWNSPTPSGYESSLTRMRNFASDRQASYLSELGNRFGRGTVHELTLSTSGKGSFRMAGVDLQPQTLRAYPYTEFELEALPAPGFRFDHWTGADGGALTTVSFESATEITAHFVPDASTELSGELLVDTTLTTANSPYVITTDLIVPTGVTLTIEAGVALELNSQTNLRVMGTLVVVGTETSKVTISGRHGETWGGVSFEEPSTQSTLSHLVIRGASRGKDPIINPSAISGLNADVVLEFIDISATRSPLFFRGGSMVLRDSLLEIPLTGDGLNVKRGSAETVRCTFTGNDSPDTDAIDYDGVIDGVIRDCRIYDFKGFNSDGIDIGENCVNCLIEGNAIYYNSDKGVSVGQGSSVILGHNLIVGCPIGVAVKDEGSVATIDQNTIVDCAEGVAVYEKNFASGGGQAIVTNTIFSGCERPQTMDHLSTISVSFSLSDTSVLPGENNLLGDPQFVDAPALNFELTAASPAIDSGDPQHEQDPDGSRIDMGASYLYSQDDYPFDFTPTVVVNEVLANSGDSPDWIELYNRTPEAINIGGWFLSDDQNELRKYRIPADTVIAAGGFLTFSEDLHFGDNSADPGRLEGFALSDTGETIHLSSAVGDQLTYYRFQEDFGSSLEGNTIGFYEKAGDGAFNFVSLETATPGLPNSPPLVGPLVISEIMYHAEVEFIEILNISNETVALFDTEKNRGWRFEKGISFHFQNEEKSALEPGERAILTNDLIAFTSEYAPSESLKIWEWTSGKLSNSGETLQLDRPGPLNDLGTLTFARVDRVKYDDKTPWDRGADGTGLSLAKIDEAQYGNDFSNWHATPPSPGALTPSQNYAEWATLWGIIDPNGNEDGDDLSNIFEYAFNRNPLIVDDSGLLTFTHDGFSAIVTFPLDAQRPDLEVILEKSSNLQNWTPVSTEIVNERRQAELTAGPIEFYRLRIVWAE